MWVCGWRDSYTGSALSEYSFDISFAVTNHEDRLYGGDAVFGAFMIGGRVATPRRAFPRAYVAAGVGFYGLYFDEEIAARSDLGAWGPYLGVGAEAFALENFALGAECRGYLFQGEDEEESFTGSAGHVMVSACWYW